MRKTVLSGLKTLSVATLLAGAALLILPAGGCAQQSSQMRVAGEEDRSADVARASDEQSSADAASAGDEQRSDKKRRTRVTKHGPR
ncbi:MAG: hypothetical protein ACYS7M_15705 [Planctomycetota bacterium]|jgi:hypothetical protein